MLRTVVRVVSDVPGVKVTSVTVVLKVLVVEGAAACAPAPPSALLRARVAVAMLVGVSARLRSSVDVSRPAMRCPGKRILAL